MNFLDLNSKQLIQNSGSQKLNIRVKNSHGMDIILYITQSVLEEVIYSEESLFYPLPRKMQHMFPRHNA